MEARMSEHGLAVEGRVKWFDHKRGFGFLVSAQLDSDVLVHHSALKEHHRRSVPEGATLEVEVMECARGLQATRVVSIDCRDAVPPRLCAPRPHNRSLDGAGDWEPVTVKWFSAMRGYGFLLREDGAELFVHTITLHEGGLRQPEPGQFLEARVVETEKGFNAVAVRRGAAQ
jgi:CspA family cold shock protein